MKTLRGTISWIVAAALVVTATPFSSEAKGYSSGGHSYSSHSSSSHSSSSGGRSSGGRSFQSGGGKSYSSGSSWGGGGAKGYSSGRSYSSSGDHLFNSHSGSVGSRSDASPNRFAFDNAAARARKEEASRQDYTRFKDTQRSSTPVTGPNRQSCPPREAIPTAGRFMCRTPMCW